MGANPECHSVSWQKNASSGHVVLWVAAGGSVSIDCKWWLEHSEAKVYLCTFALTAAVSTGSSFITFKRTCLLISSVVMNQTNGIGSVSGE